MFEYSLTIDLVPFHLFERFAVKETSSYKEYHLRQIHLGEEAITLLCCIIFISLLLSLVLLLLVSYMVGMVLILVYPYQYLLFLLH